MYDSPLKAEKARCSFRSLFCCCFVDSEWGDCVFSWNKPVWDFTPKCVWLHGGTNISERANNVSICPVPCTKSGFCHSVHNAGFVFRHLRWSYASQTFFPLDLLLMSGFFCRFISLMIMISNVVKSTSKVLVYPFFYSWLSISGTCCVTYLMWHKLGPMCAASFKRLLFVQNVLIQQWNKPVIEQ